MTQHLPLAYKLFEIAAEYEVEVRILTNEIAARDKAIKELNEAIVRQNPGSKNVRDADAVQ